jgi:TonB family protein
MIRSALALDQDLRVSGPPRVDRLRLISLLYSAAVHGWLLCLVAFGPRPSPSARRPIYDSIIRPNERKIIWYRKVPEIVPSTQISDLKQPQGKVKSNKTIVVKSANPASSRQLVLQPAPQIKLDHDIQAPNLIALTAAPSLPRPPEPKPAKPFVAPPAATRKPSPAPTLAEPALRLATTGIASTLAPLTLPSLPARAQAKTFVAPSTTGKPRGSDPRLAEPDSNLSGAGTGSVPGTVPNLSGASNLNAAIIGLNPSGPIPNVLPPGSRSAEFSAAPTVGNTASGDVKGGGITMPGLLVRDGMVKDGKTESPSAEAVPPAAVPRFRTLLYDELVPMSIRPTLSAPLRPASRTIPRALEARFQGRLVYAVVIPAPNLPEYTGDWILWFAEQQAQRPGEAPLMRAPIPLRKTEPLGIARVLSDDRSEARVQLAAIIKKDGRFDSIVLVKGPNPQVSQSAIEELKRWDFRPATRDGAPIGVEVVIEIPFNLSWLSSAQ